MNGSTMADGRFSAQILQKLNAFFYGDYYLAYLALFTALFHCANIPLTGLIFFVALSCFLLILQRDLTPFVPVTLYAVLILNDFSIFLHRATFLIFIPMAVCLILHFILYPIKKLRGGKLLLPLVLFMLALFAGGAFSEYFKYYLRGLVTTATLGPVILFAYFFFSQYVDPPEGVDLPKYTFTIFAFIGVTCFIEVFEHCYVIVPAGGKWETLGWGNINAAAALMLLAVPSSAYLLFYTKNFLRNLILLVISYATVFMTSSDGVGGVVLVFIPIILVSTITGGKLKLNKYEIFKRVTFVFACLAIIAVISIVAFGKQGELLELLWLKLADDSNRSNIYAAAFELFKKYPVFGIGQGYVPENNSLPLSGVVTYNFHSSFIHVATTMGVVGLAVYIYYFIVRYKIITERNVPFNLFVFFAFTMFEIYAAVDTGEFCVIPLMLCVTSLLTITEYVNSHPSAQPLPLALKTNLPKIFSLAKIDAAKIFVG